MPMNSFLPIAKDKHWKRIRTTLSPAFSAMKVKEVIPLMEEAADILAGKLTEAANTGKSTEYYMDSIPKCLFYHCLFLLFSRGRKH